MLVHNLVAEGTSLPGGLSCRCASLPIICEILKHARPAVDVTTLCDARDHHLRQPLHADWALDVARIDHVEDDLDDIFPVDVLVRVIQVEYVVIACFYDELESRLYAIILGRPVCASATPSAPTFLPPVCVRVLRPSVLVIVLESEAEQLVRLLDRGPSGRHLLLHRFQQLHLLGIFLIFLILSVKLPLSSFELHATLSWLRFPRVWQGRTCCLRQGKFFTRVV